MMAKAKEELIGCRFRVMRDSWSPDGTERTILEVADAEGELPPNGAWTTISDAAGTYRERFMLGEG